MNENDRQARRVPIADVDDMDSRSGNVDKFSLRWIFFRERIHADLRDKRQRPGRNPKTGEEIPITARTVVTFRPGQKLKERVEAYAGSEQ